MLLKCSQDIAEIVKYKISRLYWRRSWLRLPKLSQFRQFVLNMGQRRGEDARHPRNSQTVASFRGCSETVLQCAEIGMTSSLLLACSYLRTRCPRAPPRSRRCSGRIVSAHTAAPLRLRLPHHLHLHLQRRHCLGTRGRESAGSRSGTAGRCRWCGLHRGASV